MNISITHLSCKRQQQLFVNTRGRLDNSISLYNVLCHSFLSRLRLLRSFSGYTNIEWPMCVIRLLGFLGVHSFLKNIRNWCSYEKKQSLRRGGVKWVVARIMKFQNKQQTSFKFVFKSIKQTFQGLRLVLYDHLLLFLFYYGFISKSCPPPLGH